MGRWVTLTLGTVALALAAGCGGGGGSSSGGGVETAATVDKTTMNDALSRVEAYVPGCVDQVRAARQAGVREAPALVIQATRTVLRSLDLRVGRAAGRVAYVAPLLDYQDDGDCGGTLVLAGTHSSGTTSGTVTFTNYCTTDDDTGEKSTVNGSVAYVDRGVGTPDGPQTLELTASTPTPLRVTSSVGEDTTVALSGFSYKVGTQGKDPTPQKPDTVTIGSLGVTDNKTTHKVSVTGVSATVAIDANDDTLLKVASAKLATAEDGVVDIRTTQTLRVTEFGLTAGAIQVSGAGGKTAELTVESGKPNVFKVTAGQEVLTKSLDCTGAFRLL